jgi:acyl-CoA thioesterase I
MHRRVPRLSCRFPPSLIPVEPMRRLPPAFVLLFLVAVHPALSQGGTPFACDMPTDLVTPSASLTNATAALTAKSGLDILALGSGSTVGEGGASGGPALTYQAPDRSFPYRMLEALRALRPAVRFNLTVQGARGLTADAMLPVLRQELTGHHYNLVLWQTGTVEAVHGVRPDALRGVLEDGIEAAVQSGADVVLIDPQFSRFLRANADLGPYETVLRQMTDTAGVTLFPRFDLTQQWVNSGQVDLERVKKDQRDKTIALLNDCLGQALARYVLAGAGEH